MILDRASVKVESRDGVIMSPVGTNKYLDF